MASDQDCHLLRLPREMRNEIYSHTTSRVVPLSSYTSDLLPVDDGEASEDDESDTAEEAEEINHDHTLPTAGMSSHLSLNLLLVNRQIHDEYVEYAKPRQIFYIDIGTKDVPQALGELRLIPNMPDDALKATKHFHLFMNWSVVLHSAGNEQYAKFFTDHTKDELLNQLDITWTPSKVLRDKLQAFLVTIRSLIHPNAKVAIFIDLGGMPDPGDPFTWERLRNANGDFERPSPSDMVHALHLDTLRELETMLVWPDAGHLDVEGIAIMTLWCSLATNSAEVADSLRAWRLGSGERTVVPLYSKSAKNIVVTLVPTADECSWHGYEPDISGPLGTADSEEL
ncbi:hypothetical protein LTR56_012765 [Elasticomyces elasticus]|nr:hypothetical protein LTR22_026752 [Elasticomyces elasticus]KAK3638852.1 hypothetical protein LTR56_012765 [Elasticomyces elasticus]KAK4918628.1 hypothetical protein LTR49_013698 [Elasticomyces elasticus]KAK5735892.1 hypothetical protein LTS12_026347 [Elasticomyces elasticus]